METHPDTIVLEDSSDGANDLPKFILVGKIWSSKNPNKHGVHNIIKKAWRTRGSFTISSWKNNLYAFTFDLEEDLIKIQEAAPWSIMGNLLVLARWEREKSVEELDFNSSPFWIQIHGLPLGFMSKKNGAHIASMLGFSLEPGANNSDSKSIKNYLRLRVRIDITKPLKKGFLLKRDGKEDLWIKLQYERLSEFCYSCGRLGHTQTDCKEMRVTEIAKMEFGSFLRAELSNMDPHFMSNSTGVGSSSEALAMKDSRNLEETVAREKTGLKVADVIKDIPQATISTEDTCRSVVLKDCPSSDKVSGITPAAVDGLHDPGTGVLNLSPIQWVDKGKNPLGFGEIYKGHRASPTGVGPNQQYFVEEPPDSPIRELFDSQHSPSGLLGPNPMLSLAPIIQTPVLGLADSFNRLLNLKRKGPCEDEVNQVSSKLPRLETTQHKPRTRPAISDSTSIEIDDNNGVPSPESERKRVKKRVSVKHRSSGSSKKNSPIRLCNVNIQQGFDLSAEEMAVYVQREKYNSGVGEGLVAGPKQPLP